jgi:signal transduction histidine kinase
MGRLVAIAVDDEVAHAIGSVAAQPAVPVESATKVRDAADVETIVIGERADVVRTLYRCQAAAPQAPIVVVASDTTCDAVMQAVRMSPFGGKLVECVPASRRALLGERVRAAIELRRRRSAVNATLAALNRKLEQTTPPNPAAAVLDRLLEIAPIGVLLADADLTITQVNALATRLLGGTAIVGKRVWECFDGDQQAAIRAVVANPATAVLVSRAANEMQLEVRGVPLASAASSGYLLIVQDVTERHNLLAELRSANRAKDEFIAMLGHELRNPLAPIVTAIELMRLRHGALVEREVGAIERHVRYMVQLIDDLLDVTRIVKGKLELRLAPLDLRDAIADAVEMARPLVAQNAHQLDVDVPAGLAMVGDRGRLAQVFANLLTNAAKYTSPGGHIRVAATTDADTISVVVADNGPGISPDIRAHIFELFVQERQAIDRSRGGLGLGLAIRSLVTLHHGTVSVDSELGRGSEFAVRLPRVTA